MSEQPHRPGGTSPTDLDDRPAPAQSGEQAELARRFAVEAARLLADSRCEDVLVYDVRGLSQITDFILIASGTSDRQMASAGRYVADLGKDFDMDRIGTDRDATSIWIVVDFVEVMVHLFEPNARAHYDLEMMWGDAPQIDWQRRG